MNVRTKLSGAFALYIALLAGLSYYHIKTTRGAVSSGRQLRDLATRLRVTSTVQLERIASISRDADKYIATRKDTGYLKQFRQTIADYDAELRRLDTLPLSGKERALLAPLAAQWDSTLKVSNALGDKPDSVGINRLQETLGPLEQATATLGVASQDAMGEELDASERSQERAEELTIVAACGAVLLSLLLSALLARSIIRPVERLIEGTREMSVGHFSHRIKTRGGDELAQVSREFNAMAARLDELDRMKTEFVSKVSHDLKTPLSSMQETHSVLLEEIAGPITPKQRQLLEITQESAQRLAMMLNKLLDLSRLEAGAEATRQVVDLRPLLRRSVERLSEASTTSRVSLSLGDSTTRFLVSADPDGLMQVFDNLLENALKFSPFDGHVRVAISDLTSRGDIPPERWAALRLRGRAPAAVLVTVSDEGPGVPDDEKERIFERFYQAEAGRAVRRRGVGLGLAICHGIIAEHGGAIWVADNEPRGSTFNVLVPAAARIDGGESSAPALATNTASGS